MAADHPVVAGWEAALAGHAGSRPGIDRHRDPAVSGGSNGSNTRNDAPPPVAILDPRAAAVQLGEPPHEREPDARRPASAGARPGPAGTARRSSRGARARRRRRRPRPRAARPPRSRPHAHPDRRPSPACAGRCWRAGSRRSARPSRRRRGPSPDGCRCAGARRGSGRTRRAPAGRPLRRRSAAGSASTIPRASRSRSSRFVTSRSSRRALPAIRRARSCASSSSRWTSPRSSVIASPRIAASGVRRSCDTACRNVFFISSSARRRRVASRSTSRARASCSSACLRSVMSSRNPCQYGVLARDLDQRATCPAPRRCDRPC